MASPPFKNLCYDWFFAIVELFSLVRSSVVLIVRFLRNSHECLSAHEGTASNVRCFIIS